MTIDTKKWKKFRVGDLFELHRGTSRIMRQLQDGSMPLIAAARFNTGIAGYYDIPAEYHDAITVSLNGAGCGSTLYHNGNFAITGDAMAMICKTEISELAKLFIAAVCDSYFTSHYSYTDKCSPDKAAQDIISLPVTPAGAPDWSYMEEYMRGIQGRADAALDILSAVCSADDIEGVSRQESGKSSE